MTDLTGVVDCGLVGAPTGELPTDALGAQSVTAFGVDVAGNRTEIGYDYRVVAAPDTEPAGEVAGDPETLAHTGVDVAGLVLVGGLLVGAGSGARSGGGDFSPAEAKARRRGAAVPGGAAALSRRLPAQATGSSSTVVSAASGAFISFAYGSPYLRRNSASIDGRAGRVLIRVAARPSTSKRAVVGREASTIGLARPAIPLGVRALPGARPDPSV